MKVLGLDPSTKTGFAVLDGIDVIEFGEIRSKTNGIARVQSIGQECGMLVAKHKPELVVIEGYGFANKHTLVTLVEIGTAIRLMLYINQVPWATAAPTTLKKFVSGKGNMKKDGMMLACYKQWGFEGTDNECDAFGLAALGSYAAEPGLEPRLNKAQRECFQQWRADNLRLFV